MILYRLQPWPVVDELVYEMCPAGFELVRMARDASADERHARLEHSDFLMGSWVTTTVKLTEDDFRDLVCDNAIRLHAGMNPNFFAGTAVEPYAAVLMELPC